MRITGNDNKTDQISGTHLSDSTKETLNKGNLKGRGVQELSGCLPNTEQTSSVASKHKGIGEYLIQSFDLDKQYLS